MSDQRKAQPACVVEIAETGDVFLDVGPEKLRLRVQSLILKATSKPFAAMLGPNWTKNCERPSPEKPMEIFLPEDNAVSLKYICAVIHSRSQIIPENLSTEDILDIAIVADKYDFIDALEMANRSWLRTREKSEAGNMDLLAAAYVFRNARSFRHTSKALVMDYAGSYLDIYTEKIEEIMDWRVVYWLEEQRNFARLQLGDILIGGVNDCSCSNACGWGSRHAFAYLISLQEGKLWPKDILGVSESMERANLLRDPIPKEANIPCTSDRWHRVPNHRSSRSYRLEDLDRQIGLCLQCVLSNNRNTGYGCEHTSPMQ